MLCVLGLKLRQLMFDDLSVSHDEPKMLPIGRQ